VNEQEFLDQYMKPYTGIYNKARVFGTSKGERETLQNLSPIYANIPLPTDKEKYKSVRDQIFTDEYGEGFPEMYDKYKNLGVGAFGAVFQNPDDPSRVFKVQRQPSYYEQGKGDTEFKRQTTAAEMGVAPNIYSVSNFPTKKLTPEEELNLFDKRNEGITPRLQKMEMDKVNTIDAQGGNEKMILDHLGITGSQYDIIKSDNDVEKLQAVRNEKRKLSLALAKQKLNLADKGIVHLDLGQAPNKLREDHISYDPATNKMQFIDFGITDHYDHADNLHEHTKNLNLKDEELKDYTPGANAEHFLDHKVNNIVDAMRAVGDDEQADRFREIYDSTVDNDLIAADKFVNEYRDRVKDMSFDDANLKLRRGKKTGNLYGEIRNPTVSEYLKDFMA
jgi:hypothetical protein